MTEAVALMKIDALRHDFVRHDWTPCLWRLAETGVHGSIEETFGFKQHAACFAGLYPASSAEEFMYAVLDKGESPFRVLRYIPGRVYSSIESSNVADRVFRKMVTKALTPLNRSAFAITPSYVPWRHVGCFDIPFRKPPWAPDYSKSPTLFDVLAQAGLQWLYVGYPGSDQRTDALYEKVMRQASRSISFYYLHPAEVDWVGHAYGPDSDELRAALRHLDDRVGLILERLDDLHDEVHLIVSGDHGMLAVLRYIDIAGYLAEVEYDAGTDYLLFLDSTAARFWFLNDDARRAILDILVAIPYGHVLTQQELKRYRAWTSDNRFGDVIFMVDPGCMISPNFFQGNGRIGGMHGYLPDSPDNRAAFVISSPSIPVRRHTKSIYSIPDLFPTTLDLLNLPTPETCEATSILRQELLL